MKFKKAIKTMILVTFMLGVYLFIIYATTQIADAMNETKAPTEATTETELVEVITTETEEIEFEEEITTPIPVPDMIGMYEVDGYYHIFCTVIECNEDTFTCVLPNGEMEIFYMITDPPVNDEFEPYFEQIIFVVPIEDYYDLNKWVATNPQ